MKTVAVRNITRTDLELVDGLGVHGASTVRIEVSRSP